MEHNMHGPLNESNGLFTEVRFYTANEMQPPVEERDDAAPLEERVQGDPLAHIHTSTASPPDVFHPALEEQDLQSKPADRLQPPEGVAMEAIQSGGKGKVLDNEAKESQANVPEGGAMESVQSGGRTEVFDSEAKESQGNLPEGAAIEAVQSGGDNEVLDSEAKETQGIVGNGVPRGSSGFGAPYAPEGWQWIVHSKARINAGGFYADVSRIPPGGPQLFSLKLCSQYLEETLGLSAEERDRVMNSFETRIPASEAELATERGSCLGKRRRAEHVGTPSKGVNGQQSGGGSSADGTIITPQNLVFEEGDEEDESEEDNDKVTLDEFLKSPEYWPSIGWRLRGPEGRAQLKELAADARARGATEKASLKQLKLRLLKFPVFLGSEALEALPHILLTLVALIMTEGAIYEAKSRKMLNNELVHIIRDELAKHQKAAGLDKYGLPLKSREKKTKKVSINEAGLGKRRKSAPTPTKEEDLPPRYKRRSLNDLLRDKTPERTSPLLVNRVVQLKPSLSGLSLEVDEDDPEDETVDQPLPRNEIPEATTNALNAALVAAGDTPRGVNAPGAQADLGPAFGSPLFFADQSLGEKALRPEAHEQQTQTAGPVHTSHPPQVAPVVQPPPLPAKPSAPATVEELEISTYKKKLVKLERKRKQWCQAFEQKLAAYRKARVELEAKLEQRRAEQEAQKIRVVEETERLREMYSAALQEMTTLQAAAGVPDVAAQELEKRGSWEVIYTPAIDEARKTKKKMYEDMRKGVSEVKKSKQEEIRKRHEMYKQLGMSLPQAEIDQERAQYSAEITEMQAKLEAQKVQLDAILADLEQKANTAKNAFNEYKSQHKTLDREEARLQQLLQEPIG